MAAMLFQQKTSASGFESGGHELKFPDLDSSQFSNSLYYWSGCDYSSSTITDLDDNNNNNDNNPQQVFNNIPLFLFHDSVQIKEEKIEEEVEEKKETFYSTHHLQHSHQSHHHHPPTAAPSTVPHNACTDIISPSKQRSSTSSPTPSSPAFSSSSSSPSTSFSSLSFSLPSPASSSSSPSSYHFSDNKQPLSTSPTEITSLVSSLQFNQNARPSSEDGRDSLTELKAHDKVVIFNIINNNYTSQVDSHSVSNVKAPSPSTINSSSSSPSPSSSSSPYSTTTTTTWDVRGTDSSNTKKYSNSFIPSESYDTGVQTTKLPDIWTTFGPTKTMSFSEMTSPHNITEMVPMDMGEDSYEALDLEPLQDVNFSSFVEENEMLQDIWKDLGMYPDSSTSEEEEDESLFNESSGEDSILNLHSRTVLNGYPYTPYHNPFNFNGQSSHDVEVTYDPISSSIVSNQTQPSPISNDSSSDLPEVFENKLPVFKDIEDPSTESEKQPPRNKRPSPRQERKSSQSPTCSEKERKKPGRKPGQVSNVLHLWEFMRDLLLDPTISDGVIQWVSKADGVFRVVDSAEVARLWGEKKNNKKEMTYEKLSRSLRYSRLEGYFASLPKDKNYPKKLCFKFGPKSLQLSSSMKK